MAQILVQAPFSPAEGLLTVARSGILYTERFRVDKETITLRVPIEEGHIPNLHVQVDLVGAAPRTDDRGEVIADVDPRPAYGSGQLNLSIPPLRRTLALEVIEQDEQQTRLRHRSGGRALTVTTERGDVLLRAL